MGIQFIGVSEVENYLNKENVEFIDLRDTKEYRKKHIRGAKSMPYDSFMKEFATFTKKKIYILYCDRAQRAFWLYLPCKNQATDACRLPVE